MSEKKKVWLLILISLLSAAICFAASSPSNDDRSFWYKRLMISRIGNYVFYTTAILTNQGMIILPSYLHKISVTICQCLFKRLGVCSSQIQIKIAFPIDGWCVVPLCLCYGERVLQYAHITYYSP